jgi:adenylate kinase
MLAKRGRQIDLVLELKVDDAVLLERVEQRIKGDGPLRSDDTPETLRHRLGVYYKNTAPLLDYYRRRNKLVTVDGMAPISVVAAAIDAIVAERLKALG